MRGAWRRRPSSSTISRARSSLCTRRRRISTGRPSWPMWMWPPRLQRQSGISRPRMEQLCLMELLWWLVVQDLGTSFKTQLPMQAEPTLLPSMNYEPPLVENFITPKCFRKPKTAPLMAKTFKLMRGIKGGFRR